MNTTNNLIQTSAMSCPECCAKKGKPHAPGCRTDVPARMTMTPMLRQALKDWGRATEDDEHADAVVLDLLNLIVGPSAPPLAAYPPAGMVLVPVDASHAITDAIEEEIERQLEDSGIAPRAMSHQDADRVWSAALRAVKRSGGA